MITLVRQVGDLPHGVTFMNDPPPHDQEWTLPTRHLGRRVLIYDQLDSTNARALALSHAPDHHGLVLLARSQSAGRGQYGRSWQALPQSSVLLSVLLFPPPELRRPALITAWAAVAVSQTILQLCGVQARIKWPNDVLLSGKKVCGILTEQRTGGGAAAVVVGVGLNVRQPAEFFQAPELEHGCSLFTASGLDLAVDDVARALLHRLDEGYDRLVQGDHSTLETQWQGRLGLLGRKVHIETVQQPVQGRLLEVTFAGVMVEQEDGAMIHLQPEMIRQVTQERRGQETRAERGQETRAEREGTRAEREGTRAERQEPRTE